MIASPRPRAVLSVILPEKPAMFVTPAAPSRIRRARTFAAAAVVVLAAAPLVADEAAPLRLRGAWDDGLAEVAALRSRVSRYGAPREAEEFLITVAEDQDRATLVKALPGVPAADRRRVVKLNRMVTVPTGIYSYRQMSTSFLDRHSLELTKLVTSSQEWCGSTFVEAVVRGQRLEVRTFSYLEGEGDRTFTLEWPSGAWVEDALPVLARSLPPAPGRRRVPFLASLLGNSVRPPRLGAAEVTWAVAGDAGADRWHVRVAVEGGGVHELELEREGSRRLLSWQRPSGDRSVAVGVERLAYWRLNRPGDEVRRRALLGPPGR